MLLTASPLDLRVSSLLGLADGLATGRFVPTRPVRPPLEWPRPAARRLRPGAKVVAYLGAAAAGALLAPHAMDATSALVGRAPRPTIQLHGSSPSPFVGRPETTPPAPSMTDTSADYGG